ncbi:IclR family transcriptional regulator [Haloferacaceae archaeon DSL9]
MQDDTAPTPIRSVETSLRLIEALKRVDEAGVTELASTLELPKSTVHNHLQTLEHNEYVLKIDERYRLSCRFLELGTMARDRHPVYRIAIPQVDELATETGELAGLVIEEHGRGVFLHRAKGAQAVHVDTYAGKRISLHGAALGKAMLATMSRDRIETIIDRHGLPPLTDRTVTDPDDLFAELETVSERGVAFDDEERLRGLRSVAAAVTTDDGACLGAISVAGPTSRLRGRRYREELPELVRSAANVIELNVTYS